MIRVFSKSKARNNLNISKMKKILTVFGVVLFTSFSLTSCKGGGIESDSEMIAEYM